MEFQCLHSEKPKYYLPSRKKFQFCSRNSLLTLTEWFLPCFELPIFKSGKDDFDNAAATTSGVLKLPWHNLTGFLSEHSIEMPLFVSMSLLFNGDKVCQLPLVLLSCYGNRRDRFYRISSFPSDSTKIQKLVLPDCLAAWNHSSLMVCEDVPACLFHCLEVSWRISIQTQREEFHESFWSIVSQAVICRSLLICRSSQKGFFWEVF